MMKQGRQERDEARYQIRRAIAQMETGGGDEHMALIAKSVLSQLRDYLKTVDKS